LIKPSSPLLVALDDLELLDRGGGHVTMAASKQRADRTQRERDRCAELVRDVREEVGLEPVRLLEHGDPHVLDDVRDQACDRREGLDVAFIERGGSRDDFLDSSREDEAERIAVGVHRHAHEVRQLECLTNLLDERCGRRRLVDQQRAFARRELCRKCDLRHLHPAHELLVTAFLAEARPQRRLVDIRGRRWRQHDRPGHAKRAADRRHRRFEQRGRFLACTEEALQLRQQCEAGSLLLDFLARRRDLVVFAEVLARELIDLTLVIVEPPLPFFLTNDRVAHRIRAMAR
jgi:hypothetical protein